MMLPLIERVWADGFDPNVVIADKGYDSRENNEWLHSHGIAPVIPLRGTKSGVHRVKGTDLKFNQRGRPLCECGKPRPLVERDPEADHLVFGIAEDCYRGGKFPIPEISDCDYDVLIDPDMDLRMFGGDIPRSTHRWKVIYRKQWTQK